MTGSAPDDRVVLAVGSINADFELRVPQPPRPGRTQLGADLLRTSGGKAANVAVLATRLGVPARLFGCVGDDDLAGQALAGPRTAGVDLAGVRVAAGPTALSMIQVPPDGDKIIVLVPGANDALTEADAAALAAAVRVGAGHAVLVGDLEVPPASIRPALLAAVIAVAAAACAVGGHGSQESYPTRAGLAAMAGPVRRASTRERQRAR